jgi:hypothetical protein
MYLGRNVFASMKAEREPTVLPEPHDAHDNPEARQHKGSTCSHTRHEDVAPM